MGVIREFFARFGIQADTEKVKAWEGAVDRANQTLGDTKMRVLELASSIAGPLAAAFALDAVRDMTGEIAEQGFEIQKHAQALGISADTMQVWGHAARIAGEDAQTMHDAMQTMGERARDAIVDGPTSDAAKMIKQLGINIKDENGQLVNNSELMLRVADAMSKMTNATDRAGLAQTLLGDDGAKLAGVLLRGREGILALGEEAKSMGVVMSGEALAATNAYRLATNELSQRVKGLAMTLILELMPRITAVVSRINAWWREGDRATRVVNVLRGAIKAAALIMAAFATLKVIQGLMMLVQWLRIAGLAYLRLGVRAMWAQVRVLAIPAAILAIVLALEDLYVWLTGGDSVIGAFVDRFKESDGVLGDVARALDAIKPKLQAALSGAIEAIKRLWPLARAGIAAIFGLLEQAGAVLAPIVSELFGILVDAAEELGPPIKGLVDTIMTAVLDIVRAVWPLIKNNLGTFIALIKAAMPIIKGVITGAVTVAVGLIRVTVRVLSAVVPVVARVLATAIEWINRAIPWVQSLLFWIIETATNGWKAAQEAVSNVGAFLVDVAAKAKALGGEIAKIASAVWASIKALFERVVGWLAPKWAAFKKGLGTVRGLVSRVVDGVVGAVESLKARVMAALEPVVSFLQDWASRLDNLAESLGFDLFNQAGTGGTAATDEFFGAVARAQGRVGARAAVGAGGAGGARTVQSRVGSVTVNVGGRPDETISGAELERRTRTGVEDAASRWTEQIARDLARDAG